MHQNAYTDFYEARNLISEILEKDLVGPVTENEWLATRPSYYYISGKLYAQKENISAEETETTLQIADNDLIEADPALPLSGQLQPASMALTFCVSAETHTLEVLGSYARYLERPAEDVPFEYKHLLPVDINKAAKHKYWERVPKQFRFEVPVPDKGMTQFDIEDGLALHVFFHPSGKKRIVTAAIVNTACRSTGKERNEELCAFQPILEIRTSDNNPFQPLEQKHRAANVDQEEQELLYGGRAPFANGHGCAAIWEASEAPVWIRTSFMPCHDAEQFRPAGSGGHVVGMKFLAHGETEQIINALQTFRNDYAEWVDELAIRAAEDPRELPRAKAQHLSACRTALARITYGIQMLSEDSDGCVLRAFRLANEVMLLQRERTILRSGGRFAPEDARWYPFQLAFLLYEIGCFVNPDAKTDGEHLDREAADLLWFPTGGGKTEAYLGISAFVIFLRRLRDPQADGVAVIMRYTMRLLTLQQFERAAIMISACELLRKKYNLGGSEISIGLWVGESLSPNKLNKAKSILQRPEDDRMEDGDPVQLRICPWCGQRLGRDDYSVDLSNTRMTVRCSNPECEFHHAKNGLPVHMIDEAIYFHLPMFIVATIDKFAQMPLREEPAALFGVHTCRRPPELIIQDELHLISGQLGTIAGIYEVAVSRACCSEEGWGAKIIASTATIRGAADQILSLFGRPYTQFPPPGMHADDLYFAVPASPDERPTRRYLGIMGSGVNNASVLVRVLASLLFATRYLVVRGFPDEVIDNFWTLTNYFNTIRELGQSASEIMDEVQERFRYLANTKFARTYPGVEARPYRFLRELTSRMNSREISEVLQNGLLRSYSSESNNDNKDVYDFLVATNMISVGVDIGRLGTMIVAGQPKSNAEYIQATSRVGRNNPGLVIAVYYPSRSRDRSHYEQFQMYHSAMYRYVEPVSLTPFSERARGRALHALFVTLCRYADPNLLGSKDAAAFNTDLPISTEIQTFLEEYVQRVDPAELDGLQKDLERIKAYWAAQAEEGTLCYVDYKRPDNSLFNLMNHHEPFYAMNSMRNVDVDVGIYIYRGDRNA